MGFPAWSHVPEEPDLRLAFALLGRGSRIDDAFFDRIFPEWIQARSRVHWTPLTVIRRAVELLTRGREKNRILDVGSGVGKFCLAGAVISQARFTGIEQREHFVGISRNLSQLYRIPRVSFVAGNAFEYDWMPYNGIYLFNPFEEQRSEDRKIDSTIELSKYRYIEYVRTTEERLEALRSGTRIVTYHGFGGKMPRQYTRVVSEWCFRGPLEMWEVP